MPYVSGSVEGKRAEETFRIVVEASPNAMIMVDQNGRIVLVNKQTEALFGYPREELIGSAVDRLVPLRYRDHHPAHRQAFMHDPLARPMGEGRDLYGVRQDGSEFPIEIGLNPIQTDHGTLVLTAIVDLTHRKRADQEIQRLNRDLERHVLERTEELSAANAELESFSYSVAHDLRAPLRQIAGFSRILAEEHGQEISADAQRYIQRIQDGAQQMGRMVDALLNLASLSRQALARYYTPLGELVTAAIDGLALECEGRVIDWQIGALWNVQCDPALVKQVFVNLISNAIKFTRGRHPAVIQIGRKTMGAERVIFVKDNGAGFDMAYASKLFGVFQRLHRVQDFEGTGVGLANVQRIVQKHGGQVWAEAELDNGATFFFTIPDDPEPAEPPDWS